MRRVAAILIGSLSMATLEPILVPTPVFAQNTSGSMVCNRLSSDYEGLSKSISAITAEGVADDSAPRELVRQQRIGNEISKGSITLSLMTINKCGLPNEAPSDRYSSAALSCSLATMKGETGDACDRTKWQRDLGTITLIK